MITHPKVAIVMLACAAAPVWGQRSDAPRITVMTFQSREKGAGFKAADGVRDRLRKEFNEHQLYTLRFEDVKSSSGAANEEPVSADDEFKLAQLVHADMYLTGTVTKIATGYRLEPRLVLTRNPESPPSQPFPAVESRKLDDMGRPVARSLRDAMKQLGGEKKCVAAAAQGKAAEAVSAARRAIAAYPKAALARQCILDVYWGRAAQAKTRADSLAYADSALAASRELLRVDPKSLAALKIQSAAYTLKGDSAQARQALLALVRADPANTALVETVVNDLTRSGHASDAVSLARELLASNPDDPKVLNTAFLVYTNANDAQGVTETGQRLVAADTAKADSAFYFRMALAYESLKQPQRAAEQFAKLTAKYPKSAWNWKMYANILKEIGQTRQADDALRHAAELDPAFGAQLAMQAAESLFKARNADSALVVLQYAVSGPSADKGKLAELALNYGNDLYQTANKTLDRAQFGRALRFLRFSNTTASTPEAIVLIAATNVSIAGKAANEARDAKSCELTRTSREAYDNAKSAVASLGNDPKRGGLISQLNEALAQIKPVLDSETKAYCK